MKSLSLFSIGGTSSWAYHKSSRTLFDCGEGVCLYFEKEIFGIKNIFLTHSHGDHLSGLFGIINTRAFSMGDNEKELNVYYDKSNPFFEKFFNYLNDTFKRIPFKVNLININPFDEIQLTSDEKVICLPVFHGKYKVYSYVIQKNVKGKLKEEYRGLTSPQIVDLKKTGINVQEPNKNVPIFYYSLDSSNYLDMIGYKSYLNNCKVWVADSTFLNKVDRDDITHMTKEECLTVSSELNVGFTILTHVSNRYSSNCVDDLNKENNPKYTIVKGYYESDIFN